MKRLRTYQKEPGEPRLSRRLSKTMEPTVIVGFRIPESKKEDGIKLAKILRFKDISHFLRFLLEDALERYEENRKDIHYE